MRVFHIWLYACYGILFTACGGRTGCQVKSFPDRRSILIKQSRRLKKKLTVAFAVISVYILGQNIMVPFVRTDTVELFTNQTFIQMLQAINGSSRKAVSVFSLGIVPYMMASILYMLKNLGNSKKKHSSVISPSKQKKLLTLFICIIMAYMRTANYEYTVLLRGSPVLSRLFTMMVLIAGAFTIVWLVDWNTGDGTGGMSIIIIVNIINNIIRNILTIWIGFETGVYGGRKDVCQIILFAGIGLISMITLILFEETEFRIPIQKVMIYNDISEDNYMAFKLDPIGIQPMMYVMAFYIIPYYLFLILAYLFPDRPVFPMLAAAVGLDHFTGLVFYLILFFLLTLALVSVEISPSDMAEQMQKSGDCIIGLRPGRETQAYLRKVVLSLTLFSTCILGALLAVPMVLRIIWDLPQELTMMPMSLMFIGGISRNISREIKVVSKLDNYQEVL